MIYRRRNFFAVVVLILFSATAAVGLCAFAFDEHEYCADGGADNGLATHCACCMISGVLPIHVNVFPPTPFCSHRPADEQLILPLVLVSIFQPPRA